MLNPESELENETCKILLDFEIRADHLISIRRLDLVIVKKKESLPSGGYRRSGLPQAKTERNQEEFTI